MNEPSWRDRAVPHRAATLLGQHVGGDDAGGDGVLEVVAHVGDAVGPRHDLALRRLRRRPAPGVVADPVERLGAEVQRRQRDVGAPHRVVVAAGDVRRQGVLAGVATGAVAAVVAEGDGLGEGDVEAERPGDRRGHLGDLEGVREARALVVVGEHEHLGLAGEAAERRGVQDAVAIALEARPPLVGLLGAVAVTGADGTRRARREQLVLELLAGDPPDRSRRPRPASRRGRGGRRRPCGGAVHGRRPAVGPLLHRLRAGSFARRRARSAARRHPCRRGYGGGVTASPWTHADRRVRPPAGRARCRGWRAGRRRRRGRARRRGRRPRRAGRRPRSGPPPGSPTPRRAPDRPRSPRRTPAGRRPARRHRAAAGRRGTAARPTSGRAPARPRRRPGRRRRRPLRVAQPGPGDVGVDEVGIEVERPVEVGERGVLVAALEQGVGEVEVRLRVRRAEPDRRHVVVDRRVDVAEAAVDRRPLEVVLGVVRVGPQEQLVLGEGGLGRPDPGQQQRPVVAQHRAVQRLLVGPELGVEAVEPGGHQAQRLGDVAEVHLDEGQAVLVERQVEAAPLGVGKQRRDGDRRVDVRLRPAVVETGVVVEAGEEHRPPVARLQVDRRQRRRGARPRRRGRRPRRAGRAP